MKNIGVKGGGGKTKEGYETKSKINFVGWQHTRADNNKTNKARIIISEIQGDNKDSGNTESYNLAPNMKI